MAEEPGKEAPSPWYKRVGNQVAVTAALAGSVGLLLTNVEQIKTKLTSLFVGQGDLNPQLKIRDPRVARFANTSMFSVFLLDNAAFTKFPEDKRFYKVSFILEKQYGVAANDCSVVIDRNLTSVRGETLGNIDPNVSQRAYEVDFRMVTDQPKDREIYVSCTNGVSNSMMVSLN